ncbi:Alpha/Beta hydrolase protein [Phlyctochytrium arcticum]|nr:Alpha/Beta hydrolase protein [Phlyctochytrium arcticum]
MKQVIVDLAEETATPEDKEIASPLLVSESHTSLSGRDISLVPNALLQDLKRNQAYAAAAYCLKWFVNTNWNCRERCTTSLTQGTEMIHFFHAKESVGFIARNDARKTIILSFRGSLTPSNFINDLKLYHNQLQIGTQRLKVPADVRVHHGFQETYLAAREKILEEFAIIVKEAKYKGYKVDIVGHSLGAGVAVLAAIDLVDRLGDDVGSRTTVYAYGQPRVGNTAFATWLDSLSFTVYRITTKGDLIPAIPLREWGYKHSRPELYIPNRGKTPHTCDERPGEESAVCTNGESLGVNIFLTFATPFGVLAHINNYFDIIFGPFC